MLIFLDVSERQAISPNTMAKLTLAFGWRITDANIPSIHTIQPMNQKQDTSSNMNHGPFTRSRAKKLQQQVTTLLAEFDNNIIENVVLPKCSILVIIRFKHQGYEDLQEVEAYYMDHTKEIVLTRSGHKIVPPPSRFGLTKRSYHIS
jgi:hypothetical protein